MAQQLIVCGPPYNTGSGDLGGPTFTKVNANFTELYGKLNGALVINPSGDVTGATDGPAILAVITTATSQIATIGKALIVFAPGNYYTTLRHVFPGQADVVFQGATLWAVGSDVTAPLFTHGSAAGLTFGVLQDIDLNTTIIHPYFDRRFVALRLLNKGGCYHRVKGVQGFTIPIQLRAQTFYCSYNTVDITGTLLANAQGVDFNCASADSAFPSENVIKGGDVETTSALNQWGSVFGMTFTREYETGGYTGHSGNVWYKPCFQLANANLAWPASTLLTVNFRYFGQAIGGEWLCKVAGVSGTIEPSIIPSVTAGTLVLNATTGNMTITQGSAVATMTATGALTAGMHMRGTNPATAFPLNTYIQSVDSATQITLTQPAGASSANYKGIFVTPTVDGAATLVYLGPYRRSVAWMRDCGNNNAVYDARWETGVGEAAIYSGTHLFPQSTAGIPSNFACTLANKSQGSVKNCQFPVRVNGATYAVGDLVRKVQVGATYWEAVVGGVAAGAEPVPADVAGTKFTDGAVTWLAKNIPTTESRGDIGEYCGVTTPIHGSVGNTIYKNTNAAMVDNLHLRMVGSAAGILVRGLCKNTTGGALTQSFAAGELILGRDGIILGSTTAILGCLIKTDRLKNFVIRKNFGPYTASRFRLMPFDKTFTKLVCTPAQEPYHRRISSDCNLISGANEYAEPDDGPHLEVACLVNADVDNIFAGIVKGSTGSPAACVVSGWTVNEVPHRAVSGFNANTNPITSEVQLFSLFNDSGYRSSLGTPTIGIFQTKGEFIQNANAVAGNTTPAGYDVTTIGILATAWAGATAVVRGQYVTAGGNAYAANGAFTTGTSPAGTGFDTVDGTASAVLEGVASWDYMGPVAVVSPTANVP